MRFNSVIGAMIFIILSSTLAMVVFVQTKSFGTLLSRIITDISEKKADTKVAISNIEISVFPPGVELIKVSVEKQFKDGKSFQAELGTFGFYFGLLEIEERKLAFGEIRISDSVIDYNYPESKEKDIEQIEQKIIDEIFDYSRRLPLRVDTLLVENTRVHANHDLLNIRRLKLFKNSKSFVARFHVANIKPLAEKNLTIDEVWADAEITKQDIVLHRLKLQHDVHSLILKGKVHNYPLLKKAEVSVNGEGLLYLKGLLGVDMPGPIEIESGAAQVNFNMNMLKGKLTGKSNVEVKDFRSNLAFADSLTASLSLEDGNLHLSGLELIYKDEKLKVLESAIIANFEKGTYLTHPIKGKVENLKFSNALRILGPSFHPLKGSLNGKLTFRHEKGNLFFLPENGFKIINLALVVGDKKPFQILKLTEVRLTDADFAVINQEFQMSSLINLPHSQFEIEGHVSKKGSNFSVIDGKIDLTDFGDIAQLGITGKGILSIEVHGPLDDTEMNFKGRMADFAVLGYKLGLSDIDLNIALGDSTVTIRKLESILGKTTISGNGAINYKTRDIALGINSPSASYHDLSLILQPIFSKLTFLPQDFELNANIDAYIHGKTSLDKLKVKSHITFTDMIAYGENVNRGSFDIGFNDEKVSIANFAANKEKGTIEGNFSFHMPTDTLSLKFNWDNLSISSFNMTRKLGLNFDGYMVGGIQGEGKVKDYVLTMKNQISNTKSQNYSYPDSVFDLKIMPDRIIGQANLLGPVIQTSFDYSLSNERKSKVSVNIDMPDVKPFTVAFLGPHLDQEEFTGKFRFNLNMDFNHGFNHLDLKATLKELRFSHESFKVNYQSEKPQFLVEDSRLVNWNLNINEPDLYVVTKGNGSFGKEVTIVNEFHVNSKIAELFLSQILSSEGFLRNIVKIEGRGNDYILTANSKSENLSLSIEGAPFPINEMKYDIDYANNRLVINDLQTNLESGSVSLRGDVYFSGNVPDVNIKYSLDRAEIPILGKSSVNVTGEGIILGNELPYNVGGEILVNKGQIVNELSDFNSKSVAQVRYLPKNQESFLGKLFVLNLNIKAENPIRITNSLMDVALKGEVRLFGNPVRPRGEGRVFAPANSSRIFFKNNEYFLSNADINFSPKKDIANPDFDVQAITYISSYKINAKAYGDLERFNFDLTSDPALPRNSILSLIAFGYTDEIQSTLTQGEQQNLTQVGVGSFVFDRFKISDILNKQFGLQVNLGTVFEQSQTQSMLSGRSQEGAGQLGRTRSATKIELKKRLDEALTLSVSSTMGGSIGQRQSMNLTYSVTKKVQVEGVYELRTNAEGEEDIIDKSIGVDLKFRKTFK
ncbi:MAG TPA: translocation/assembly module TamB domain-containing protein [Bacteriovoracaceae bacterium]|nr:translocation/assembly module TamB domain-containing protein [Bacteriovoracaceae bacterium]